LVLTGCPRAAGVAFQPEFGSRRISRMVAFGAECDCIEVDGNPVALVTTSAGIRAIHRRMQLRCRRFNPRSAFEAQIRAERGTGSARAADADEFGTTRELVTGRAQARRDKRRLKTDIQENSGGLRKVRGRRGRPAILGGSGTTRPKRLGVLSSLVLEG